MTDTTSMHLRRDAMPRRPLRGCHGGEGELDFTTLYDAATGGRASAVRFLHDDILPPGASIGIHRHEENEEFYIILSGSGVMHLDGRDVPVRAGDATAVFPGGTHGLRNTGDAPLRVLVVCAEPTP